MLTNASSKNPKTKDQEAASLYNDIYTLFIEGDLEKASAEKRKADALYGVHYWTPQLLYIEAILNIKQQKDSAAITGLQTLIKTYPSSPLIEKATTMIDVLRRRSQIEAYLTSLQVTRQTEEKIMVPEDKKQVTKLPADKLVIKDSVVKVNQPITDGAFTLMPASKHLVLMILDKVDGVFVNESKNAFDRYNKDNYYGQPIQIVKDVLDAERSILVISSFADAETALKYYDKIKKEAKNEVSWLPANKYSFLIITDKNLELLKTNKNLSGYKSLLNTQYPNRF